MTRVSVADRTRTSEVLIHLRDWSGRVVETIYDPDELPIVALPSLGTTVDKYLSTHGYITDVVIELWQAARDSYLTSSPWETFKSRVTSRGMSLTVAHFIWSNLHIDDVTRVYYPEEHYPEEMNY